mmetsp:Transcript_75881/g.217194  ORF Transcript_75881/g.217194 Transcript_75881/m.217194 type:complete len:86 (-) Transcript_75881:1788-2045(-)
MRVLSIRPLFELGRAKTYGRLHEHELNAQLQVLPKGQHVVPKLLAQQTSVALHCSVLTAEAQVLCCLHSLAAWSLKEPGPARHAP